VDERANQADRRFSLAEMLLIMTTLAVPMQVIRVGYDWEAETVIHVGLFLLLAAAIGLLVLLCLGRQGAVVFLFVVYLEILLLLLLTWF
jgi:hypothetical protein